MGRTILGIFAVLFCLQGQCSIVSGLKCYECKLSTWCLNNNGYKKECNTKYCTIFRQEYMDPAGWLVKFYRACENNPEHINTIITTAEYKTYYRTCSTDLCNSSDGTDVGNTSNNTDLSSSGDVIFINGTGLNAASQLEYNYYIVTLILYLIQVFF